VNAITHKLVELCDHLRAAVLPSFGMYAARGHAGAAVGGDVTFRIDRDAESALAAYMAEQAPAWAYYSEDRGLQGPAHPELILVVDPLDGTRPAAAGFEAACVSVAAVPARDVPTMGDVVAGVVQEVKSGDVFVAEKGGGVRMRRAAGEDIPLLPSSHTDIDTLFWALGFRGRPVVILASVLQELIDRSSVGGAVFDLGSATYSITRILTGQLDAYVDIGPAIIAAHPATEEQFRRVGLGGVLCNSPYDLAAAHLLCTEAGIPIGDAQGRSLARKPVLGADADHQLACIVAGSGALRDSLVDVVRRGIEGLPA